MRLITLILLIVILAEGLALVVQRRESAHREARMLAVMELYRSRGSESIVNGLERQVALPLAGGARLQDALKSLRTVSVTPSLPTGIPVYVDPVGLQESGHTLASQIKPPPSGNLRTLNDQIRAVLASLGLTYVVKDGLFMITSQQSAAGMRNEATTEDVLYRRFRDVMP
jgi:hypothetical protein